MIVRRPGEGRNDAGSNAFYGDAEPTGGIMNMHEPQILIPVKCSACGQESLARLSVALVADALISGSPLHLRSTCHPAEWAASPAEIVTIRAHLRANSIAAQVPGGADAGAGEGPLTPRRGVYSGTGIGRQVERTQYVQKPRNLFPQCFRNAGSGVEERQAAAAEGQFPHKQRGSRMGNIFSRIREAISAQARSAKWRQCSR